MDVKVMTPEETRAALSGSGRKVVEYPHEVPGFPGVRFAFEIQRVVGVPHIMWDAFPAFQEAGEEEPAPDRKVWHRDLEPAREPGEEDGPERLWRYVRARVSGGSRTPRVYFGARESVPADAVHFQDIPAPVFQWLFDQIEAHNAGGPLRSGADGRFPDAEGAGGTGPDRAALPVVTSDAGAD